MLSSGHIGTDPHIELAKGLDYVNVPEIYLFLVSWNISVFGQTAPIRGLVFCKSTWTATVQKLGGPFYMADSYWALWSVLWL